MTHDLHTLKRIDARTVWQHEARDFTPWLLEHIDELNRAIGFEIELDGREGRVGPFAVDLFGTEVQTNHPAIIENQLTDTDHSHLGQLLTYAAGLKAGVIVWIAPRFRDEHREALTWLNEVSGEAVNFFGVEIEILEINGQRAPNFKLVAEPNTWAKTGAALTWSQAALQSPRMAAYQAFYSDVLALLRERHPDVTSMRKAQPASWLSMAAGRAAYRFTLAFTQDARFCMQAEADTTDREKNLEDIESLWQNLDPAEWQDLGQLVLDTSETRRAQRITLFAPRSVTIDSDEEELDWLKEWIVGSTARFVEYFRPRIKALS